MLATVKNNDLGVLLTRPREAAEGFAERLRTELGGGLSEELAICIAPLTEIVPVRADIALSDGMALIFTSANAVARAPLGEGRIAFCVGDKTAELARSQGYAAQSARGTADDLVTLIEASAFRGELLHLRGRHTQGDVAGRLAGLGFSVEEVVVYEQVPCAFSDEAKDWILSTKSVIAPVFSPKSAQFLVEALQALPESVKLSLQLVAMSHAVAEVLQGAGLRASVVEAPTGAAMVRGVGDCVLRSRSA